MLPSLPQTAAAPRMDERRRRPQEPAELERVFPLAEVGEACHAGGAGGGGGGRQAWTSNAAPNTPGEAAAQATSARRWEAEGLATRAQTRLLLRSAQVRGGEGRPPGCGGRQAAAGRGQKQDFHLAARVLRLWCGLAKNERLIPETNAAPALAKRAADAPRGSATCQRPPDRPGTALSGSWLQAGRTSGDKSHQPPVQILEILCRMRRRAPLPAG